MPRWWLTAGLVALAGASATLVARPPPLPLSGVRPTESGPRAWRVLRDGLTTVAIRDEVARPYGLLALRVGSEGLPELLAPHLATIDQRGHWVLADGLLIAEATEGPTGAWLAERWHDLDVLRGLAPDAAPWLVAGNAVWVTVDAGDPERRLDELEPVTREWSVDPPEVGFAAAPRPTRWRHTVAFETGRLDPRRHAAALVLRELVLRAAGERRPTLSVRATAAGGWFEVAGKCDRHEVERCVDALRAAPALALERADLADAVARARVEREDALRGPGVALATVEAWAAGGAPDDVDAVTAALPDIGLADLEALVAALSRVPATYVPPRRTRAPSRPRAVDRAPTTVRSRDGRVVAVTDRLSGTFVAHLVHDTGWRDAPLACEIARGLERDPPPFAPGVRLSVEACRWSEVEWRLDGPAGAARDSLARLDAALDAASGTVGGRLAHDRELRALRLWYGEVPAAPASVPVDAPLTSSRALGQAGTRAAYYGPATADEVATWLPGPAYAARQPPPAAGPPRDELVLDGASGPGLAAVQVTAAPADAATGAAYAAALRRAAAREDLEVRVVPIGADLVVTVQGDDEPDDLRDVQQLLRVVHAPVTPPREDLARAAAEWRWDDVRLGAMAWSGAGVTDFVLSSGDAPIRFGAARKGRLVVGPEVGVVAPR